MMMAHDRNEKIPSRMSTAMPTGPTWLRNPVTPPLNWAGGGAWASRGGIRPRRGLKSKLNLSK
jgi:hypothetical protein